MTDVIFDSLDLGDTWRAWDLGDRVVLYRLNDSETYIHEIHPGETAGCGLEVQFNQKVQDKNFLVAPPDLKKTLFRRWGLNIDLQNL